MAFTKENKIKEFRVNVNCKYINRGSVSEIYSALVAHKELVLIHYSGFAGLTFPSSNQK